jgi:probable rRNA maturation factor
LDAPTVVLSFEIEGVGGELVGEIVVAPGYVGFDPGEVEELVVHGALHLGGLDHGEDFEASEMARVQRRVMEAVGGV